MGFEFGKGYLFHSPEKPTTNKILKVTTRHPFFSGQAVFSIAVSNHRNLANDFYKSSLLKPAIQPGAADDFSMMKKCKNDHD